MKKVTIKKFLIHAVLYAGIAIAIYYLYSPLNNHPNNKTGSAIHFVYQKF